MTTRTPIPPYWPTLRPQRGRGVNAETRPQNGASPHPTGTRPAGDAGRPQAESPTTNAILPLVQDAVEKLAAAVAEAAARQLAAGSWAAPDRRWLTVREAAEYARTSRWAIYEAIRSGALEAHSVGRRLVVSRDAVDAWVSRQPVRLEGSAKA